MRIHLSRTEAALLAGVLALLALALFGPSVAQPVHYNVFADARTLWGIPLAMDVLTNVPFALAALTGFWLLGRRTGPALTTIEREMAALFLIGLLLVAPGSAWYHLHPDNAGLAVDRLSIAVAFAGLLGLAVAMHVSERAGAALGLLLLLLGPLAVQWWAVTGNLLPWAVLQGGGMLLLAAMAMLPRRSNWAINWWWVLLAYGVAKLLEVGDRQVFELTNHLISGHSLKHLAAAAATVPVLSALARAARCRQNARGPGKTVLAHRSEA